MTILNPSSAGPAAPIVAAAPASAVSWAAVIAGAFVAAATTLILLAIGFGFGLASVSPWPRSGASIASFSLAAAIWLVVVQWLSSALGGYLTGRLRTRWIGLHTHEVAFRDTAHGFLTWAVATVIGALLLSSAAASIVGGGVHVATTVASGGAQGAAAQHHGNGFSPSRDYDLDMLFRQQAAATSTAAPNANPGEARGEAAHILAMGATGSGVSADDRTYLTQLIATRTGLSQADAAKRVDAVLAKEKEAADKVRVAADKARKAAATGAIFLAVSMLIGAFIACVAAAIGGHARDLHV
jgi:hypothetical protein